MFKHHGEGRGVAELLMTDSLLFSCEFIELVTSYAVAGLEFPSSSKGSALESAAGVCSLLMVDCAFSDFVTSSSVTGPELLVSNEGWASSGATGVFRVLIFGCEFIELFTSSVAAGPGGLVSIESITHATETLRCARQARKNAASVISSFGMK